ncbi:ribonuclease HII [Criibacterium bergeronii]|uniref:Ribonuclease HII n=1 Tax=Criibacterium bergeronii TaxID=1871336 RepID=A0A371IME3_9FIRM|nr:ribonuclease HII [Criibacterium bergeronii]MBS6062297.1 ribonuclease HII [Peptostreptococcaceae bacterium]RDY21647.1 ribonuclease HII [Criibacterium bergeronii]
MQDITKLSATNLKEYLKQVNVEDYPNYIKMLDTSTKKTVLAIKTSLQKKYQAYQDELKRIADLYKIHQDIQNHYGIKNILCIDEVGRGPLAGPVTVCGVMLSENPNILNVNDSKKLNAVKRQQIYDLALNKGINYHIESVSNKEIDEMNILNATFFAMKKVVEHFKTAEFVLVDGNMKIPNLNLNQSAIIGGDSKVYGIGLASIIAKVTRDTYMEKMSQIYPHYYFDKNKGYGTSEHIEGLKKYGPCEIHRLSFIKNII